MERFLKAIERSVETGNWYAAVTLALTVPDICGWLDDPLATSRQRYESWFNRYLLNTYKKPFFGPDFAFLTAGDCYALRCSYLHEGSDDLTRQRAQETLAKIRFSTTGSHLIRVEDVLMVDVQSFCRELCAAARCWQADATTKPDVVSRLAELIRIETQGFSLAPGIFVQ